MKELSKNTNKTVYCITVSYVNRTTNVYDAQVIYNR